MLAHDSGYHYDWNLGPKWPYADFLRAKQLVGVNHYEIDDRHKELIATDQQLRERGIEILSSGEAKGYSVLSQGLAKFADAVPEGGAEFIGNFNWGCTEVLVSQGRMNIQLDELLKLTKIPAQDWAYQQFEIAREEFHQQKFRQALQSVTRAIDGQDDKPGNKTEFRFHFLLGIIRLGSYSNSSPEVVSPHLAQQAFLAAARYAESAYRSDAGQALICAGRAALIDGDIESAIGHTRKGLNLAPGHALGLYQLGRALFIKGARSEATDKLSDAILLNVEYVLHAAGDPGISAKTDFLNGVLRQAYERYEARHRQVAERFRQARQTLLNYSFRDVPLANLHLGGMGEIQKATKTAEEMAATKTLFAYNAAIEHLLEKFRHFQTCFDEFKGHCVQSLQEQVLRPPRRDDFLPPGEAEDAKGVPKSSKAWLLSGIVTGLMVFLLQSGQSSQSTRDGFWESIPGMLLIPLVFAVSIGAAVAMLESLYREYVRARQKSALAAFDAAWYSYISLKNSLDREIAEIKGMSLPRECSPPLRESLAKPGAPADALQAPKRVSAWAKL